MPDPQVQLKCALDLVNAFVIPRVPLNFPQVQKALPEAPSLTRLSQTDQQVSDLFVLIA